MRSKFGDNEPQDVSYHGNAFLRLMGYIKPYWKTVALCCVLVGLLTVFDIARPRIIGDAIDKYITQQSAQDLPPETRFQGILIAAGLDVAVRDYVMNAAATEEFWRRLTPIVDYLLPQYRQEGRTELVLAVGCTGGRHRSVAVAHRLAAYIDALGFSVAESHRDMGR